MDNTNKFSSFLSADIAYFLGLVIGRGSLLQQPPDQCRVKIDFPFKSLKVADDLMSPTLSGRDVFLHLSHSVDVIVERVKSIGFAVTKNSDEDSKFIGIVADGISTGIGAQFLKYMVNDENNDYHNFRIPRAIFESNRNIQQEFLRGYFDVTGYARKSNAYFDNQHRVYLEVDHRNWFLPLDLYKLFQLVGIPVQTVDFGHPNFRDPSNSRGAWAKEHQLKIFTNEFEPIGSYLEHKNRAIAYFADINRSLSKVPSAANQGSNVKVKPAHPDEESEKLPAFLRGQHFNHYTELLSFLEESDRVKAYNPVNG